MENQLNNVGGRSYISNGGGMHLDEEVRVANWRIGNLDLLVRLFAVLLTLPAVIVIGSNEQTNELPHTNVRVTAKWQYLSAFVYVFVVDMIACVYAVFSLVLSYTIRGRKKTSLPELFIIVLDMLMVALLFSAVGAGGAMGLLGYTGNKHVMWNKICTSAFDEFCVKADAAAALTTLAALAYLILVMFAGLRLNKRSI